MSQAFQPEDPLLDVDRRTDGPGVTHIDPADPAAPMYELLAKLRKPVALRDIMIRPMREGYARQDLPDVATHDPLIDSCRAFAAKLEASGKQNVQLAVVEGMPHGFYFCPGIFPKQEADIYSAVASFLDRHLSGNS